MITMTDLKSCTDMQISENKVMINLDWFNHPQLITKRAYYNFYFHIIEQKFLRTERQT